MPLMEIIVMAKLKKQEFKVGRQPIICVTLSDIHIGHQPVEQLEKEFYDEENGFFTQLDGIVEYCKENDIIFGGVAITGDYWNHQLSLNSPHARFGLALAHALAAIVITQYGGKVIFVRGTRSHDLNQLALLETLTYEYEDQFFIFDTVSSMEIHGYDVIIIPEEYMKNPDEYYKEFFDRKWDLILGHGFFAFNNFSKNEVERPMPEMPIFDQEQFITMARAIIFGHDHGHKSYRDVLQYNGSWSRLCHGEEDEKGGLIVYLDDGQVDIDRMINTLAPTFQSVALEKLVKGELNFETAVKAIEKLKTKVDFLKIKVSLDTVKENPAMVELISATFASQYKRGIIIESPPFSRKDGELVILAREQANDEEGEVSVEERREANKFGFLFESGLHVDEKVERFIIAKHGEAAAIDLDDIRDALSDSDK